MDEGEQCERSDPVVVEVGIDCLLKPSPVTVEPCSRAVGDEAGPQSRTSARRTDGSAVPQRRIDGHYVAWTAA